MNRIEDLIDKWEKVNKATHNATGRNDPQVTNIIDDLKRLNKNQSDKTLNNTNVEEAKAKINDLEVFGDGDLFQLLAKASSKSQGWMKSTKAMSVGIGCVVQVTTQQKNVDGTYSIAEALTYVPNTFIYKDKNKDGNKYLCPIDSSIVRK